jgi:hypothetical protein
MSSAVHSAQTPLSSLPPWRPLIDGPAAARVRSVVAQLADALAEWPLEEPSPAQVAADRALFFAYLAEEMPRGGYDEWAQHYLVRAVECTAQPMAPCLYRGSSGIAWVLQHLVHSTEADEDFFNARIDRGLQSMLGSSPWQGHYDLFAGLVGYAVYALERLPNPIAADCLSRIVEQLIGLSVSTPDGITWQTKPELLSVQTRAAFPDGFYDLGVAHGVPGVIAVLAAIRAAGFESAPLRVLYERAVSWVLAQQLGPDAEAALPYWVRQDVAPVPARSAWCYGDPGAATALYAAARAVGDHTLELHALANARRSARRPIDCCEVVDAAICHGASGLAHLYNRLWQASGEEIFASAARRWLRETLQWQRSGAGIAGFQSWFQERDQPAIWIDDSSLLSGACGVGLALLATISTTEPAWDRVLLASLPTTR